MSLKYVIRPMTEDDTFAVELIEQVIFSLPFFTTAAAVSSHELSIARIRTSSFSLILYLLLLCIAVYFS